MDIDSNEQSLVDLTFIEFDPNDPTASHRASAPSAKPRQRRITEAEKANMRAVRAKGPCVRCKILKKQCDDGEPCKQCPRQDVTATRDHWKVLGCLRDLTSLAELDVFSRLDESWRIVMSSPVQSEVAELRHIYASDSTTKERPGGYNIQGRYKCLLDLKSEISDRSNSRDGFNSLDESGCDKTVGFAALSVLGGLSVNFAYDHIVRLAEAFLIASSVYLMLEEDCYDRTQCPIHNPAIVQTDNNNQVYRSTLSQHLQSYLSAFQERCSKRGQLTPQAWAATFYSICLLNDSLMTLEAVGIHDNMANNVPAAHSRHYQNQLRAIYMSLVRIFCWTQNQSDLLGKSSGADQERVPSLVLFEIKAMSEHEKWESLGIESTKTFLELLGRPDKSACEKVRLHFFRKCFYCAETRLDHGKSWEFSQETFPIRTSAAIKSMDYYFYLACREWSIFRHAANTESGTLHLTFVESVPEEGLLASKMDEAQVYKQQAHELVSSFDSLMEGRMSALEHEEQLSDMLSMPNTFGNWELTQLSKFLPLDVANRHSLSVFSFKTPSSHTSSLRKLKKIPLEEYDCCGTLLATMQDLIDHYAQCHSNSALYDELMVEESLVDEQPEEMPDNRTEVSLNEWVSKTNRTDAKGESGIQS